MQRILVTGSSGYLAASLLEQLRAHHPSACLLGVDQVAGGAGLDEFEQADIRQADLKTLVRRFAPDTVIHLAFVLQPQRSKSLAHEINVDGTRRLFEALSRAVPQRLVVCSSATAFGAWPNAQPYQDRDLPRGVPSFGYSADKAEVEQMTAEFQAQHAECATSWVRPTTVLGPEANNFISRYLVGSPAFVDSSRGTARFQFVHQDDVARAMRLVLEHSASGPFNLAPDDNLTFAEMAALAGKPCWSLPASVTTGLTWLAWQSRIGVFEIPPGFLPFVRYPWLVRTDRLREELGFEFEYTSRETLVSLLRAVGRIRSLWRCYDYGDSAS